MRYYIQRYIKTFWNNETIMCKHNRQLLTMSFYALNRFYTLSKIYWAWLIAFYLSAPLNPFRISSSSPCICLCKSTIQPTRKYDFIYCNSVYIHKESVMILGRENIWWVVASESKWHPHVVLTPDMSKSRKTRHIYLSR